MIAILFLVARWPETDPEQAFGLSQTPEPTAMAATPAGGRGAS
ncbi:MAG TPA: hypothetical protein VLW52_06490 [Opitutaceae bacterium]|nr:hypothetical protein [Opitutaceae bacterium]